MVIFARVLGATSKQLLYVAKCKLAFAFTFQAVEQISIFSVYLNACT
jgi:hypothetical protein